MKPALAEIVCIVDRSGSMQSIATDAVGGFNAFLEGQQAHPGSARLTLALFDHEYLVVHNAVDLKEVPPLSTKTYVPRGSTALYDAVGRTVDEIGRRLAATPEPERPEKVIVAILTDGMENSSHEYTQQRVFDMIEHQRSKYGWEFVFLAANQDAFAAAAALAISAADAAGYSASPSGTRAAWADINERVSKKRSI